MDRPADPPVDRRETALGPRVAVRGAAALGLLAALLMGSPRAASALSAVSLVLANPTAGAAGHHVVAGTTASSIPEGGSLRVTYPPGFDLSGAMLGSTSGFGGAVVSLTVQGQTAVLTCSADSALAGALTAELLGVVNATAVGFYTVDVESRDAADAPREGPTASALFDIDPGPISASACVVSAGPSAVADGVSAVAVTIVLRDAYGNPLAGVDSTAISVAVGGGAATVQKLAATSALDGSFGVQLRSTAAGTRTVSASVASIVLEQTAQATFVAGPADAAASSASIEPSAVADLTDVAIVTVVVRDTWGNPVAGVDSAAVSLTVTGSDWRLDKLAGATDATGTLLAAVRSSRAEHKTVAVALGLIPVGSVLAMDFVAGAPDHFAFTLAGAGTVVAGQARALDLSVRDAFDNRVIQYLGAVDLSTDTAGPGSNISWSGSGAGTLTPGPPGAAGYAFAAQDSGAVQLGVSDTRAESLRVDVTGGTLTAVAQLTVIAADPQTLTIGSGDGQTAVVAATLPQPLVVVAADAFGNPVADRAVLFAPSGDGVVDTDLSIVGLQNSATTGSDGTARCQRWALGTLAGPQLLTVTADFSAGATFDATAVAGPPATLALEPQGTLALAAGQTATIAARASDTYDNPIAGVEVTLFVVDALDGVLRGVGETDSLGVAQQRGNTAADGRVHVGYAAATAAGRSDRLDAVAPGLGSNAVTDLLITSVASPAAAVRLAVPPGDVHAGAVAPLGIELVDAYGNRVAGAWASLELQADGASGIGFANSALGPFASPSRFAVSTGDTLWWRGGPVGVHLLRARDLASALLPDSIDVRVVAALEVARLEVTAPGNVVAGTNFTMIVRGFDAWDNFAEEAAAPLSFDLVDAADTTVVLTARPAVQAGALAGGTFTTAFQRIDRAGVMRLRVGAAGRGYFSDRMTVQPGLAWELVWVGPDTLSGVVAGDAVDATVEARDALGNPVPGVPVDVLFVENGSLEVTPGATGADGLALARLRTANSVGTSRLRLSILDGAPAARETQTLLVQTRSGAVARLRATPAATQMTAGDALAIEVLALDIHDNDVLDATDLVQLEALSAGATVVPVLGALTGGRLSAALHDTTVGSSRVVAWLQGTPATRDTSASVSVLPAGLTSIAAVTDTVLAIAAGADTLLQARVTDRYGNPVPGASVRVELLAAPVGAVLRDFVAPGDDGLTLTDAQGLAEARLTLSPLVGDHRVRLSILDRTPPDTESAVWRVTSNAGAPASLALAGPAGPWTAGVLQHLSVELLDSAGNRIPTAGSVTLVPSHPAATVTPNPVPLSGGVGTCDVTAFVAGLLTVQGALVGQLGVAGQLPARAIVAATPAGVIAVPVVEPAVNTANGLAVTRCVAGPVHDTWGNTVAIGTRVTVDADRGVLISEDADPLAAGLQRATDAAGQVEARLAAPVVASTAVLHFTAGAATGTASAQFESAAALVYDGGLAPAVVAPGQTVGFDLRLRNLGQADAQLVSAATSFELDDGVGHSFVAALAADTLVPAGGSAVLSFVPTPIDPAFHPGPRRPVVRAAGPDEHGQPVMAWVALPDGSLAVWALDVLATTVSPAEAIVGDTVAVDVTVRNTGAAPVQLTSITLTPLPAMDIASMAPAPLPLLAPGAQQTHRTRVELGPATLPRSYQFESLVAGEVGGAAFQMPPDTTLGPLRVVRSGALAAVTGSVSPGRVAHGSAITFVARVHNGGGVTVSLDALATRAQLGSGAGAWTGALTQPVAVAAGADAELRFGPMLVDPLLGAGTYDLQLELAGTEAGRAFTDTVSFAQAVVVEAPAQIALEAPPLLPAVVSLGGQVRLTARVTNTGTATVVLDALASRLRLGEPAAARVVALLDPVGPTVLTTGSTSLRLLPVDLPLDLSLASPPAVLELRGAQNGLPFALDLPLPDGTLSLQQPAGLQIVSTVASQPAISAGQARPWAASVALRNNGQATLAVALDAARTHLDLLLDGVAAAGYTVQPRASLVGGDLLLGAGELDTLVFDVTTSGAAVGTLALLPVVGARDVNSLEQLTDGSSDGGSGAVVVQAPALLGSPRVRALPDTLSAGRAPGWSARLLVTNAGGSVAQLSSLSTATRVRAEFGGSPWPIMAALVPATFLGSGGDLLAAGATDTLSFQLQGVPATAGALRLTAVIGLIEVNSARVITDSALVDVPVISPPLLAIAGLSGEAVGTMVATTPGRIEVTAGKPARLDVRLLNRGGGVADALRIHIDTDSGRLGSDESLASLRDSLELELAVAGAPSPAEEWLRVAWVSATDRWGAGPAAFDPVAAGDSILLVTLQPAALLAERVQPRDLALQPIAQITAAQTLDFLVDLELFNPGESPVVLAAPEPGNVQFQLGSQPQNDYVVVAPAALLGRNDLLLPAGARDVFRFTVQRAGIGAGAVLVRGDANGNDGLNGEALAAQAEAPLDVQAAAGLRIVRTVALNPRAPDPRVNAGQPIRARVVLVNSGQEAIDALTVGIAGTQPVPSSALPAVLPHLAAGATDSVEFDVSVTPGLGPETLTARVLSAVSANTGQPVLELAPLDDAAPLWVQRPVSLAFAVTLASSPDPRSATVSPGQLVTLRVAVDRMPPADQQGDWQPVDADFVLLAPFAIEPPRALPLRLEPAQPSLDLELRAPTQAGSYTVTAQLASDVLDPNDPTRSALATALVQSVQVEVSGGTGITSCSLDVIAPAGAVDRTLSLDQLFAVRGRVEAPPNLQSRALQLLLPAGMALPGGDPLRPLAADEDTASWMVRAPDVAGSGLALRLLATATDIQSGDAIAETCAVLMVDVVQPAGAQVVGAFSAPASARDQGQVYPDASMTVRGWVVASGQAALTGAPALRLDLPAGYTFEAPSVTTALLASPADTASWRVRAPATPGAGVDALALLMTTLPRDENSGVEVGDPARAFTLPVATVRSVVELRAGDAPGVGPIVGEQQLTDRMRVLIQNGSSAALRWTRVEVTIVDDAGTPLPNPSGAVAELALVSEASGAVLDTRSASSNPVVLTPGLVAGVGENVAVRLAVRAATGDAFAAFALRIDGPGLSAEALDNAPVAIQLADLQGVPRASITSSVAVRSPATLTASGHAYPNPFVPSREPAVIAYALPAAGAVEIGIYDLLGGVVRTWRFDGGDPRAAAGVHDGDVTWDGTNGRGQPVRSGVYVCRIRGGGQEAMLRIAVTR